MSKKGKQQVRRYERTSPRRVVVRGLTRREADLKKLAPALREMARLAIQARAEADAQAEYEARKASTENRSA